MPAVSRATLAPFLGPAAVVYLIAAQASAPGRLDTAAWIVALTAMLLSSAVLIPQRHSSAGAQRVGWLGLCVALALVTTMQSSVGQFPAIEIVRVVTYALIGFLLTDLALTVPEPTRGWAMWNGRKTRALGLFVAVLACVLAAIEAAPALRFNGSIWLVAPWLSRAPEGVAGASVLLALLIRTERARRGDKPEALAENAWAQLGLLIPAVTVCLAFLALRYQLFDVTRAWFRFALCVSAVMLVRSHVLMIDPRYRLSVGSAARRSIAVLLVLVGVCGATIGLRKHLPTEPLDLSLWVVAGLLLAVGGYGLLSRALRYWLAPARGALLDAVETATQRLADVASLADVGAAVLPGLRAASDTTDGLILLYAFDPAVEVSIDAAGQARLSQAQPPLALSHQVHEHPHEIIVRRPLEDALVRRADVRPLVDALVRLDALCVIPLRNQGDLEGMLVLPRGARHASLTLEELAALDRFGSLLAAFVAVISREARAGLRLNDVIVARDQTQAQIATLTLELSRLQRHERALASGHHVHERVAPIAYSSKQRVLCDRLAQLAPMDVPVLLRAHAGSDLEPLMRWYHAHTGRADQALVVADCASMQPLDQRRALLGDDTEGAQTPGYLRLAQGGTLVLLDVPALTPAMQNELHQVIVRKRMRPDAANVDLVVDVRMLLSTRVDLAPLADSARFDRDLLERLSPVTLAVPSLRERREDLQSLVLLAIDRAARMCGHEALGIEPDALAALSEHRFAGNERELISVIEQAAARAQTPRISLADLKLPKLSASGATTAPSTHPLSGTYDTVEKRVLKHALHEAGGNKSEAARLLGLKRTTFLDKLRRHDLDDGAPSRAPSS